ncbi:MAG TPA: PHP domain-containing protein [Gammaproteobacteria bacterium]|nr:PHP domain-containing protein [Gammaproteobacteria bacterium]
MSTRYDLHCHSVASDGTLSPEELVSAAHVAGVEVLALTDHDTTAGIAAATACAQTLGMRLLPGVEISVSWGGQTVHVLGLGIDPGCEVLQAGLGGLRTFRDWRAVEIGRRLARAGIGGCYDGARKLAKGSIVGRTHFAQHLVATGHAASVREVFKRFLVNNKPGHVAGQWADLEAVMSWIAAAGGMAVIAHPARYAMTASKLRRLIGEFRECGGCAIEVVSGSHSRDNIAAMAALSRSEKMLASCGSDYHGPENPWVRLGQLAELPHGCRPVWESEHWPKLQAAGASAVVQA